MCCVNCRHCEEPVGQQIVSTAMIPPPATERPQPPPPPGGWPADPDPDIWVTVTNGKPDPEFRGPDPWKQDREPDPVATQPIPVDTGWDAWYQKLADNKPPKVLPRSYLKWLAVDLDGTLAEGIWTPEEPTSEIGDPIGQNVVKVRRLAEQGWKIVIHTARPWHDYESIEAWANHYKVPFSRIVCGKLLAAAYIDDRAIDAADEDWTPRGRDARAEG